MERYLGPFSPHAYALLRFFAGWMFMMHGTQKLFAWPPRPGGGGGGALSGLTLTAGMIEFVGGLLIAIGLGAAWAAFLSSGTMAVAYFKSHAGTGLEFWPIVNRGELAVVYCFLFLYIAAVGSGIWSVDAALRKRKSAT